MSKDVLVRPVISAPGVAFSLQGTTYDGALIVDAVKTNNTAIRFCVAPREMKRGPAIVLNKQAAIDLALAIIKACGE